jgi:hypothetical protein
LPDLRIRDLSKTHPNGVDAALAREHYGASATAQS